MIVVTGTSGFIGKHLLNKLIMQFGAENILALTSSPESKCKYLLHQHYTFDKNIFIDNGINNIETVIHAGAFIPKKSADANAYDLCFSSIESTRKLLEALPASVKKFIFISTVDVYDSESKITEETNINPASLYGHSKYYCEKMIQAWAVDKKVNTIMLRLGHVYGPGEENYQKIIPLTIHKLLKGESPQLWGLGKETRSFIYIEDVLDAILQAVSKSVTCNVVNIVSGTAKSIADIIQLIIEISGKNISPTIIPSNAEGRNLEFDNSRMTNYLCAENWDLKKGLQEEWKHMKSLA